MSLSRLPSLLEEVDSLERRRIWRGFLRGLYHLRPRPSCKADPATCELDRDYFLFGYMMGWLVKLALLHYGYSDLLPVLAPVLV